MDVKVIKIGGDREPWISTTDVEMVQKIRRKFNDIGYEFYESKELVQIFNKICSCIDWLQSFVYMSSFNYLGGNSNGTGNDHETTYYLSSQINSLNVIVDGVMEFLRAIDGYKETSLRKKFLNTKDKFLKTISINYTAIKDLGIDITNDFNFFKEVRAVFAAHQNNLGEIGNKYFAGWSSIDNVENDVVYVSYLYKEKEGYRFQVLDNEIYDYIQYCLSHLQVIYDNL